MKNINYSENFYTNITSTKHTDLIQKYIELVTNNPPEKVNEYLNILEEAGFGEPIWQAAIAGESKVKLFSSSSAGLFLINNLYIAYFPNHISNISDQYDNSNIGYSFFDNNITANIIKNDEDRKILIDTAAEKIYVGVSSFSLDKDFEVIKQLVSENKKRFNDLLKEKEVEDNKNSLITTNERPEMKNVDSRFNTNNYIISSNYIPDGFIFHSPVIYTASVPFHFKNLAVPQEGYQKVYRECIEMIKNDIDNKKYDAIFNLSFNTHYIQANYEIVLIGDGVLINK